MVPRMNPRIPSAPRPQFRCTIVAVALGLLALSLQSAEIPPAAAFKFSLQKRVESPADSGQYKITTTPETWDARRTAIIVCDMWDLHHCKNAVTRETEMAPRMNQVLTTARQAGALIIHAPSSCMDFYQDHPGRKLAQGAPKAANLPKDIASWCRKIPAEEKGKYPVDQTDGGEDDDLVEHAAWAKHLTELGRNPRAPWKRQIDVLEIKAHDAISDSGVEIWNLLEQRGIRNVILLGVHINMCVLGRPFGLRQMAQNGKHVVLMRDLTDSMYNPARWPHVNHYRGTDLVIEHIEKFVAPSITSDQLLGGKPFVFSMDPDAKNRK